MGQASLPNEEAGRDEQGRFAKGRSGNPKGRTPVPPEVRQAASPHTAEAVAVLVEVLNDPKATLPMRSMAALGILRAAGGLGKISASQAAEKTRLRYNPPSNALEAYALATKALRDIAGDENMPASARAKASAKMRKYGRT